MATRPAPRRKQPNPRRTFTVKEQLIGKLGPRGYGRLLDQLAAQGKK